MWELIAPAGSDGKENEKKGHTDQMHDSSSLRMRSKRLCAV